MKQLIITAAILLSFSACRTDMVIPSGPRTTETRVIDQSFDAVSVSSVINLYLSSGELSLEVETNENVHEYVEIFVYNNCLYVKTDNMISFRKNADIKVFLTVDQLRQIKASGASNVKIDDVLSSNGEFALSVSGASKIECRNQGEIQADKIKVKSSGASEIDLKLTCDNLEAEADGASKLSFFGLADDVELDLSGASDVEAFDLDILRLNAKLSGASNANVTVQDFLKAKLSGASMVRYKGNPELDYDLSGGSQIKKSN